jgi:hypothetical protein
LPFGVAFDAIGDTKGYRPVARASQVVLDEISRDLEAARIAVGPHAAANVVVEDREVRAVARQRDVPAQLAALDRARVADQTPQADSAVDPTALDVDEIGPAAFELAADARVARDQRAALEQNHVASNVRSRELAARRDVERTAYLHVAEAVRANRARPVIIIIIVVIVVVLRRGAEAVQCEDGKNTGEQPSMVVHDHRAREPGFTACKTRADLTRVA